MSRLCPLNIDSVLTESLLEKPPKEILRIVALHLQGQLQVGYHLSSGVIYAVGYHQGVEWTMRITPEEAAIVMKDLLTRSFRVLQSKQNAPMETLSVEGLHSNAILDLGTSGARWEGDERNGTPFGFGVLYNTQNEKVYEGFLIGDDAWGFGVEYEEDTHGVQFTGWKLKGVKFGKGVLFDRRGEPTIVYMENDAPTEESNMFTSDLDKATISSDQPVTEFDPPVFWRLQTLTVGSIHLSARVVFTIKNQPALTTLVLQLCERVFNPTSPVIADCPQLKRIEFADQAFASYPFPTLSNLPSLCTIQFGRSCFSSPSNCSLVGLPSLTSLVFMNGALFNCNEALFQGTSLDQLSQADLPMLKTITFDHNAFHGEPGAHRQQSRHPPFYYRNKLKMQGMNEGVLFHRLAESRHDEHGPDQFPLFRNDHPGS